MPEQNPNQFSHNEHPVEFVPPSEATERYKSLGRRATHELLKNVHLEQQLLTDQLTGLPNETAYKLALQQAIDLENAKGYEKDAETNLAILEIDVDGFKGVNDTFGHSTGDKVLQLIGDALERGVRKSDMPTHLGDKSVNDTDKQGTNGAKVAHKHGDEFGIILTAVTPEKPADPDMKPAQRLDAVKGRVGASVTGAIANSEHNGKLLELGVGVSIGATFYKARESVEAFLERADALMYADKLARKAGR